MNFGASKDRLYIVYDPSAWDPEKVAGASGIYLTDTFEGADKWRKNTNHTNCPIYSYRQGRKGLEDERMEDEVKKDSMGPIPKKVIVKPLDIFLICCAFLALKVSKLLGWDDEPDE